jgi:hypothetical protein
VWRQLVQRLAFLRSKRFALNKLRGERASTGPVGNDRLCAAAFKLADDIACKVRLPPAASNG